VDAAHRSRQRVLTLWNGDKVDVVRHEAIAENSDAVARSVSAQEIEVEAAVIGGVEDRLAIVSALRNVVSGARKDEAGAAGHTSRRWEPRSKALK
jgi:hypothetical protein